VERHPGSRRDTAGNRFTLNASSWPYCAYTNVLDRLAADGPIPVGNTAGGIHTAFIKAEQVKWGKIVREANIRIE
jgi:hypothetical protein